jgi:hypothetical protein
MDWCCWCNTDNAVVASSNHQDDFDKTNPRYLAGSTGFAAQWNHSLVDLRCFHHVMAVNWLKYRDIHIGWHHFGSEVTTRITPRGARVLTLVQAQFFSGSPILDALQIDTKVAPSQLTPRIDRER